VPLPYPSTRRDDEVVDMLHGVRVADPYRWLEDTWSADTAEWVKLQNEVTESVLAQMPSRAAILARLTDVWDYPRKGAPFERGGRWFQLRNSGLQPQAVLYVMSSPDDEGRVLLDPNTLSPDGTVALTAWTVSASGALLAYATSDSGSDWMTWRVRAIDTGEDADDVLEWSKFSDAVFSPDGRELFYSALDAPQPGREFLEQSRVPRIMRHVLGQPQDTDRLVFTASDQPEWIPHASRTDDGRFLIVTISRGTFPESRLHVLDMTSPDAALRPLVDDFASSADVVGNVDQTFYLCTDADAERRRVVAVDLDNPDRSQWREVVAETSDTLLEAHLFGGRLVAHYLHDAHSRLAVLDLDGTPVRDVELPGIATVTELSGHHDRDVFHFALTSFSDSGSLWRHDLTSGETVRISAPAARIDADAIVTEQVFVPSADGTSVPVFLVHRRDVTPTGDVPVLLYGYGGFNIPVTPTFAASRAVWVERGGVFAVANLRGGGEYGRAWYDAGRLANKQNVFDDFCAAARWLGGESGWSRPERVAIHGGSNGGLLVGACLTQHPELFGAAVPAVGVLDMLRFHTFTIGWAWVSDYGSPDDAEAFPWLRAYSPLHNVRPGASYPATLVLTGDHDDRVAPGHSFKFAAALQAAQAGDAPALIRVETAAGHGAGKPTQKLIEEAADMLAFIEHALGVVSAT
jgi:prolyl oligopeptidase